MHRILLAFGVLVTLTKCCEGQLGGESLYSTRYQRLDIDTILASPRLVTNYVQCLLNRKPCPPEGKDLKRILPEALRTKCGRCWPNQKEGAIKVITKLYYDYPQQYLALRQRWDPTGKYHRRFEEYLRDQQFNVISGNGFEGDINRGDQSQITVRVTQLDEQLPTRQIEQATPQVQATTTRAIRSNTNANSVPSNRNANSVPSNTNANSVPSNRNANSVPSNANANSVPTERTQELANQPEILVTRPFPLLGNIVQRVFMPRWTRGPVIFFG